MNYDIFLAYVYMFLYFYDCFRHCITLYKRNGFVATLAMAKVVFVFFELLKQMKLYWVVTGGVREIEGKKEGPLFSLCYHCIIHRDIW